MRAQNVEFEGVITLDYSTVFMLQKQILIAFFMKALIVPPVASDIQKFRYYFTEG